MNIELHKLLFVLKDDIEIVVVVNGSQVFGGKNDYKGKAELREYKDIGIDYMEIGNGGVVYLECNIV